MEITKKISIRAALDQILEAYNTEPHPCHWRIRAAIYAAKETILDEEARLERILDNPESGDDPDKIGY